MKKIIANIALFIFGLSCLAYAQTTIKAEVNKRRISTDEAITYKLTIVSSANQQLLPQLPGFEGFRIISSSQSSSASFAANKSKITSVFIFVLAPTATGKFTIGPASLSLKEETLSSDSFEIEVVQGEKKAPDKKPLPASKEPQYTL